MVTVINLFIYLFIYLFINFFLQFSEKKRVQINSDLVEKEPRVNKIPNQDIKLGEVRVDHRLM